MFPWTWVYGGQGSKKYCDTNQQILLNAFFVVADEKRKRIAKCEQKQKGNESYISWYWLCDEEMMVEK